MFSIRNVTRLTPIKVCLIDCRIDVQKVSLSPQWHVKGSDCGLRPQRNQNHHVQAGNQRLLHRQKKCVSSVKQEGSGLVKKLRSCHSAVHLTQISVSQKALKKE